MQSRTSTNHILFIYLFVNILLCTQFVALLVVTAATALPKPAEENVRDPKFIIPIYHNGEPLPAPAPPGQRTLLPGLLPPAPVNNNVNIIQALLAALIPGLNLNPNKITNTKLVGADAPTKTLFFSTPFGVFPMPAAGAPPVGRQLQDSICPEGVDCASFLLLQQLLSAQLQSPVPQNSFLQQPQPLAFSDYSHFNTQNQYTPFQQYQYQQQQVPFPSYFFTLPKQQNQNNINNLYHNYQQQQQLQQQSPVFPFFVTRSPIPSTLNPTPQLVVFDTPNIPPMPLNLPMIPYEATETETETETEYSMNTKNPDMIAYDMEMAAEIEVINTYVHDS